MNSYRTMVWVVARALLLYWAACVDMVSVNLQARYSPIRFDYFAYSRLRWDEYHKRSAGVLAAVGECCSTAGV